MNRTDTWNENYEQLWLFVSQNHRGPSRHRLEEHRMLNWLKFNRKKLNKNELSDERKQKLEQLQEYIRSFHRVNQYC
ncbi:MAG: helicase associated domain-containing protein [Prevotella sp.]